MYNQREVHGHRVVALIDQCLGDIQRLDPVRGERIREQRLVHAIALERRRHHMLQLGRDVVCVQHGVLGNLFQAVRAMAEDIGQRPHEHAHLAMEGHHAAKALARIAVHVLNQPEHAVLVLHHEGHGCIRRQRFGQNRRARAGPATAMRRGKCLVQVDVHRINAQVARPHAAHDGVEVRPVAIEIAARRMDQVGNLADVGFEQAARVRIGQHDAGNVVRMLQFLAQHVHVDTAPLVRLDLVHDEPALHCCRRVRAVRRGGHQDTLARLALAARNQRLPDRQHARQLAMRARFRAHRHGRHVGQHFQPGRQLVDQFQRALHGRLRLHRVDVAKTREARHLLVEARIVFHRTAAQREEAEVDGIIPLRQAHVMAHHFRLRQARQAGRHLARHAAETARPVLRRGQVHAGRLSCPDLEDQPLSLQQAA